MQLGYELVTQFIIGVERQHPSCGYLRDSKIALTGELIEWSVNDLDPRVGPNDIQGTVATATVDHQDAPSPCQPVEGTCNIRLLVIGNYDRSNVFDHNDDTHLTKAKQQVRRDVLLACGYDQRLPLYCRNVPGRW